MSGTQLLDTLGGRLSGFRGRLQANASLAQIMWFRTGGVADLLALPADRDDLIFLMKALAQDIPVTIVGLGSNILLRDGGVRGVVIRLSSKGFGQTVREDGNRLRVGAAVADRRLASAARNETLGGLEFYHGIPGGVGGALRMNAGANGTETSDRLVEAVAVDRQGHTRVLSVADMDYAYRHSGASPDLIFVEAVFQAEPDAADQIRARMEAVQRHREGAQPIKSRTGGSTFKNPEGKKAWQLIDAAGCRGLTIGAAQVSEMHCNFLINTGSATAHDLEYLGETVRARVLENSGVRLSWEIKRIGEFDKGGVITPFLGMD